jgi:Hypothetical glycosyl hydrolase 6
MPQRTNRRRFLQATAGSGAAVVLGATKSLTAQNADPQKEKAHKPVTIDGPRPLPDAEGLASKYWIDPTIAAWPAGPMRKVHIEYHTSKHVQRLAERFNAHDFADTLTRAHVTGVTVFAKDMYGYSYYPSKAGPAHPRLSFDLLGAQVAALRERNISVLAYYMTTWNPELADRHPEWLVVQEPGKKSRPRVEDVPADQKAFKGGITPEIVQRSKNAASPQAEADPWKEDKAYRAYLWKFCLGQEGFVQGELDHIREIVSQYEIDALWIDGDGPSTCYCDECIRQLRKKGLDPFNSGVQHDHKVGLNYSFLKRIHDLVKEVRPNCLVCPQNQGSLGLARRASLIDYTDHEALFTDAQHYGYHYFGTMIRYARGFGVPIYGLTVCFKDFWADFGGLKHPAQLHTELAEYVSQGARCDVGDQVHPNGQLDPAVYHVIGKSYGQLEQLQPFLEQAVPVTEAALLASGGDLGMPCNEMNYGWVKLLTECRVQFDIVERDTKWEERYGLMILPEDFWVDQALADRLHAFIAAGGSMIVAHRGGLLAGSQKTWLERYGFRYAGMSPFTPAYLVAPPNFAADLPAYAYALYGGASQWRVSGPGSNLAALGEPLYQRSPAHYMSHLQTPFDHVTDYSALARSGRVGLVSFPIGRNYYEQGFWIYRQAFQKLLDEVRPTPLIQTDAHLSTALSLTYQAAKPETGRKERYLVHIINYSPVRRTPKHTDFYEDPIPLRDVTVRLNLPLKNAKARGLYAGREIPVRRAAGGGAEVVVPHVNIHEVICFENQDG